MQKIIQNKSVIIVNYHQVTTTENRLAKHAAPTFSHFVATCDIFHVKYVMKTCNLPDRIKYTEF